MEQSGSLSDISKLARRGMNAIRGPKKNRDRVASKQNDNFYLTRILRASVRVGPVSGQHECTKVSDGLSVCWSNLHLLPAMECVKVPAFCSLFTFSLVKGSNFCQYESIKLLVMRWELKMYRFMTIQPITLTRMCPNG